MIKRYICDLDMPTATRDRQIRELSAELAAHMIAHSDLRPSDQYMINVRVRKVRNRAKERTTEEYVISASIIL